MDAATERRAHALFLAALDLERGERTAFLDRAATEDETGADRARTLLAAVARADADGCFELPQSGSVLSQFLRGAFDALQGAPDAPGRAPALAGALVGDRFRVAELIGSGRFGGVFLAEDSISGKPVAVKLFLGPEPVTSITAPRERIALLALDVPGVARLIDYGEFEGRPYLVTEFCPGRPFPGRRETVEWDALRDTAVSLLEALSSVHAAAVVHGDLKPANVLVDDDGRPRLVDLGIAVGAAVQLAHESEPSWGGTLPYLAPELLQPDASGPTRRSDLYAVGVMLFEALTGRCPHTPPVPPESPWTEDGRRSFIRQRTTEDVDLTPLRHLDLPTAARRTLAALLARKASSRPASAADAVALLRGRSPPEIRVRSGVTADGSRQSAAELRELFRGHDRLFHVRRDAAALLHLRTRGRADAVAAELSRWVRSGLATMTDDRVSVSRDALSRLERLPPAEGPAWDGQGEPLSPDAIAVLDLVVAAGDRAALPEIAAAGDLDPARVATLADGFVDQGVMERLADGAIRAGFTAPGWEDLDRRTAAHWSLAASLPPGAGGRLRHLIEARRYELVAEEALVAGRARRGLGDIGRARGLLRSALVVVRNAGRPSAEEAALIRELLETAIAESSPQGIRFALHEASRSTAAGVATHGIQVLAEAALTAMSGHGTRALAIAESVQIPPDDVLLELRRQSIRVFATQYVPEEVATPVVLSACAWADSTTDDPRVRCEAYAWRATHAYRTRRYADAVAANRAALQLSESVRARMIALLGAAGAGLEAHALDDVIEDALHARDLARSARHPDFEARAEYYSRAARYRSGQGIERDDELATAVRALPDPVSRGLLLLLEAAVCWRHGAEREAIEHAGDAARAWRTIGAHHVAALADAIAAACGDEEAVAAADERIDEALRGGVPGLALQVIALHALAAGSEHAARRDIVRELAGKLSDTPQDRRREVLSIEECLRFTAS